MRDMVSRTGDFSCKVLTQLTWGRGGSFILDQVLVWVGENCRRPWTSDQGMGFVGAGQEGNGQQLRDLCP